MNLSVTYKDAEIHKDAKRQTPLCSALEGAFHFIKLLTVGKI